MEMIPSPRLGFLRGVFLANTHRLSIKTQVLWQISSIQELPEWGQAVKICCCCNTGINNYAFFFCHVIKQVSISLTTVNVTIANRHQLVLACTILLRKELLRDPACSGSKTYNTLKHEQIITSVVHKLFWPRAANRIPKTTDFNTLALFKQFLNTVVLSQYLSSCSVCIFTYVM